MIKSCHGFLHAGLCMQTGFCRIRSCAHHESARASVTGHAGCPPTPGTYAIKSGDTLTIIGDKCGTTVECLATANHLPNVNSILAGAMLQVPSSCADATSPSLPSPAPAGATASPSSAGTQIDTQTLTSAMIF